jgi:hypothetical protein
MKAYALNRRLNDLESTAYAGWIPSTDINGNRAWIKGHGSGIKFYRDLLEAGHGRHYPTLDELGEDLRQLVDLWSRAEVDGDNFGGIARANRELARRILGGHS